MSRTFLATQLLLLLVTVGCGGKKLPEITPVSGTVRVNGTPQPGLMVRFLPDPEQGNETSFYSEGVTDQQGKYELSYLYDGKEGKGASIGWHRIVVMDTTLKPAGPGRSQGQPSVPYTYASPATSPLKQEVKLDGGPIDFDLRK